MAGTGGRSWRDLLGRARKRKSPFGSGVELQEAALRLLDHHQNLADLLLEDQASKLGVPTAALAAQTTVTNLERICRAPASPSPVPLLSLDQRVCRAVLQRMLAWVLDAVGKEKQEDVSTVQAVKFWLNVFSVSVYGHVAHPESVQQFFRHTLTEVLTYNPVLKVSDAIQMQKEWSFTRTSSLLTALYRKLLVAFSAKESICQLQQVLETHEVNWQHVLSCVSTLVVCQAEAEQLFKDLLSHLLLKAFGNYDMENMITAFLIARQAALEGPAVFMPYPEWFKASFGNAGGHHGSSKKALVFLFEFLSELVPFEAAPYLKVHIMYPPFVPAKHRSLLLEYITLAKTRLADLRVAIEDMGLYEDLSATDEAVQLPKTPDAHMAFIDSLKRADKIPSNLYSTYLQACHAMKEKRLQDDSKAEPSHSKEPVEQLKAELAELRTLVVDQAQWEDVPAQIAVVSDRLRSVLGDSSAEDEAAPLNSPIPVSIPAPRLDPCQQSVVDLLLTSFCQTLIAASSFNPPDRQGPCLSLLVKMMCGHRNLLPALLARLCQLIYHQGPSLTDAHILGLAAFVIHLSECRALIPGVEAQFGVSQPAPEKALSISEYWTCLLLCRTEESFAFCMRFCTAAATYVMCKFSSCSHDDFCALIPPGLVKKLSFREWLLMELEVCPDKDILSASERQDFHYWAIYQHYLPAPSAAGGCDGDLEKACAVIISALLDSSHRILVGLPPSALITTCQKGRKTVLDCEDFFGFVNTELKNVCSRGYSLSYDITAHFFRGLLNASLDCEEAAEGVNDALTACQTKCPLVLLSAAVLVSLLFFSLLDLISAKIAPKEGVDFQTSLEWSMEILQCLEEKGTSWPLLFHSAERGPGTYRVLRSAASDRHIRLLPLAFYSLSPRFPRELLQRDPTFLCTALDLYLQLLRLFVEGEVLPQSDRDPTEHDPLEVISLARRFLLGALPHCPAHSFGNIQPLLASCEELDPELGATLLHFSQPAVAMELEEELELF
ncbi:Fanconi anemia, complementation group A [Willisornis vidua]|uniref:Fanconi anemia, complementation group A n=1 Tax=Willisornis vidua TaxID=1566151 RepID=A0ABQ9DR45_9PASS|nr:Fanconi anemia, complementation group A [Willisornis vidua]